MRTLLIAALSLSIFSGIAAAERNHNRGGRHEQRGPVVRDQRNDNRSPQRANRPARRANRQAIDRRPILVTNGRFVFQDGRTRTYRQPAHRRYYDASVRPRLIVESYPREPGYVWVRGNWTYVGSEWQWRGGHYAPDARYQTYYDDGSYDYSPSFKVGIGFSIGG